MDVEFYIVCSFLSPSRRKCHGTDTLAVAYIMLEVLSNQKGRPERLFFSSEVNSLTPVISKHQTCIIKKTAVMGLVQDALVFCVSGSILCTKPLESSILSVEVTKPEEFMCSCVLAYRTIPKQ